MPPIPASFTMYTTVFHVLKHFTKLLHAEEIRHMCFCCVGISLILGGLKIIKYIKYIFRVYRQNVLQTSYIAQMSYHPVLFLRLNNTVCYSRASLLS